MNDLTLHPDKKMTELLCSLGQNEQFLQLLQLLSARTAELAVWSKDLEKDVHIRWAQGRVQELDDLLSAFDNRHKTRAVQAQIKDTP